MITALIDTGAILALLDRDDMWHVPCSKAFEHLRLPLMTTAAVLAELFHLVGDDERQMRAAWDFIGSRAVTVAPITDTDLPSIRALMIKYHGGPMDFADATLVHLADRERLITIFTVDHGDFATYRIAGNTRFRVVPAPRRIR